MAKQDPAPNNLTEVIKSAGFRPGRAGEEDCHFGITIAKDGTWYYRGTPIRRLALCKLFSTVLRKEQDGSYWLVTPAERGRIDVEDAPFTAVAMHAEGSGRDQVLRFRTNLDHEIEAGDRHAIRVELDHDSRTPRPYVEVRDRLDALIVRAVFYDMVDLAVEGDVAGVRQLGVWSGGVFFPIGPVPE